MYCRKLKLRRAILQTKSKGKNHELIRFICKKFFTIKYLFCIEEIFNINYNDVSFFNF